MKQLLSKPVRWLTKWAWQREIGIVDGLAELKELSMKPGAMELKIETQPEIANQVATCLAKLVYTAENYTEMQFECGAKFKEKYDYLIVTIQKARGKTPHQLKMEAFEERDKAKEQLQPFLDLCHKLGWNGVENSKIAHVFLENLIANS